MNAVKVTAVEAVQFSAPLIVPIRYGTIERRKSASVLIRVRAENGFVGYGEACCVPQLSGESAESVVSLIDLYLRGLLVGTDAIAWRPTMGFFRRRFPRSFVALSAVESALIDLVGKSLGTSASVLLDGRYRSEVEVCACISWNKDADAMASDAAAKSKDHSILKLYAGPEDLKSDLRRVEKVRRLVDKDMRIMVDVKGLWSTHTAVSAAPVLQELGVFLVEQPLSPRNHLGAIEVTRIYRDQYGILTAADESLETPEDAFRLSAEGGFTSFNIGISKMGGLDPALQAAHVAQAAHIPILMGSFAELGIATAAGLHLAAAMPELVATSYLSGPDRYTETITSPTLLPQNGKTAIPDRPGLGVDVDEEKILAMTAKG